MNEDALPHLPALLKRDRKWVAWKYQQRGTGKPTKPPINPHTGTLANVADPATWGSYDQAVARARRDKLAGVGYVLTDDDSLTGADLDRVRDTNTEKLEPWAAEIVALGESYIEVSPSGTGLRIFWKGKIDQSIKSDPLCVEIYRNGRYLTITGQHVEGTPSEILPAPKTEAALRARVNGAKAEPPPRSQKGRDNGWQSVNSEALQNLAAWVPSLFGNAAKPTNAGGYRVSSVMLGRDLEEDLSISPQGIKDFGIHDQGDEREGKRTPIDLVMEYGGKELGEAVDWLREKLGHELGPIVSDNDHVSRARRLRDMRRPHLVHYRGDFMDFQAGGYRVVDDSVVDADTWDFLDKARTRRGKQATLVVRFDPDRQSVGETLAALRSLTILDPIREMPCWLNGREDLPPGELAAFPNGLLDLRDNKLHSTDPAFFTTAALGFDYVADAPKPVAWLRFLNEIFDGDDTDEQINALQEAFGYLLTTDTSQEKAVLILGPKRSGKGTIVGMLRKLLAPSAVAGPSLKSLGTNFGLAPLIGKQLAIIDDLRVGSPSDQDVLIENVLKITGRGFFTIDRKYKTTWSGSLLVKLLLLSNVMPKLGDDSAALASRLLVFITRQSFYDREDPRLLEDKLAPERLGVLHWALDGLKRLRERKRFIETGASKEARERLANLGSPVRAFITECCVLAPEANTPKRAVYNAWRNYAKNNDIFPGTLEKFCEGLYAATSGRVRSGKPRDRNSSRVPSFMGIRLRAAQEEPPF